jgi:hypothetical protein
MRASRLALCVLLLLSIAGLAIAAVSASRVTVASTATVIAASTSARASIVVRNRGTVSVYLGGPTVTSSAGFELSAGDAIGIELWPGESLYGITASSTARVDVLRTKN